MSKPFESIRHGLIEAIAHATGEPVAARIHILTRPDIKALRRSLRFTQQKSPPGLALPSPPCGTGSAETASTAPSTTYSKTSLD